MFKDLFWRRLCSNEGITLTVYLLLYDMTLWAVMWCDPKVIGQDLFCEENGIKMKQKTHFCFVNLRTEKKTAVKKRMWLVICYVSKLCTHFTRKPIKSSNEELASIHMYKAAYRQKFLNQLYYSNGKIIVRKK